ncbi:SDR family NAD(P)-dependent oxidoreductase [Streptomyces sp. NPDC096205]|uniref:SDR family NAD(P)-dependent oxidoreductase n=1 Tax=Streptomyces sp. NPDC096205 TaxID=3366081 RepID=UPI00382137B0
MIDVSDACRVADSGPGCAVAVVGVGVRLPGGITDLTGLWALLAEGRDVIGRVPPDRFPVEQFVCDAPARPGKSYTAAGAFLDDVASFDADFFGISPREAAQLDPQHRLLMECAVEALDDAGIDPMALAGSDTAVMTGLSAHDYAALQEQRPRAVDAHTMTGLAACNAANRLSYAFGLRGPSQAVDTACSSALTAVHQACETLRSGRSAVALAGGVHVMVAPSGFIGFSQASMLSPTGRCRPLSANADGFVRAEGAGVVVLKPLAAALADGDRVHAVIPASAVNADGRTLGLTFPSARAQAELISRTYAAAGLSAEDVAYVELHGTGTGIGDPVECRAVGQALGRGRASGPLPVGSVKSNLGHSEAASGMAGLFKGLLVLRNERIPRSLYATPLNPAINFTHLGLDPAVDERPLPVGGQRVVGVNSFGFGGANAHVVLAPPPVPSQRRTPERPSVALRTTPTSRPQARLPIVISARTPQAVRQAADAWASHFAALAQQPQPEKAFYDAAYTACRRRAWHTYRAAVLAPDAEGAAAELRALTAAEGLEPLPAATGGRIAFVFDGNGSQWPGMGAELLRGDRAFAQEVAAVDEALLPLLGWSVREEMAAGPARQDWRRTEVAQPMLFAVQAGLVAALRSRGFVPAAVCGHSAGEVAAAYAAGALSRDQACLVVAERSRAQGRTAGTGRMAAVHLGPTMAADKLVALGLDDRLVVAAVNSDDDVTVSGNAQALEELGRVLAEDGVFFRDLGLDHAFHSPAMDEVQPRLKEALSSLAPSATTLPLVSTVTGAVVEGTELDAEYWWHNTRRPVLFSQAVRELTGPDLDCDVLVEIGPHPALRTYLRRTTADAEIRPVTCLTTLSREQAGPAALDATHSRLLALGVEVEWTTFFPHPGDVADLPAYPWQRERHWSGSPDWWLEGAGADEAEPERHPLLGRRQAGPEAVWHRRIEQGNPSWVRDHKVDGAVLWPGAGYIDMALGAGRAAFDGPVEVTGLALSAALRLPVDDPAMDIALSTRLTADGGFTVSSRGGSGAWTQHATARVRRLLRRPPEQLDTEALTHRVGKHVDIADFYAACARARLDYGPAFRGVTALRTADGEAVASFTLPLDSVSLPLDGADGHCAHPAALDACFQAALALGPSFTDTPAPYVPVRVDAVHWWTALPAAGLVHLRARAASFDRITLDVTVADTGGDVVMEVRGLHAQRLDSAHPRMQHLEETVRAAPLPGTTAPTTPPLTAPAAALDASAAARAALTRRWREQHDYARYRHDLGAVVAHHTAAALAALLPGRGEFTLADLVAAGAEPRYKRLLGVLLAITTRYGMTAAAGEDRWLLARRPRPEEHFRRALERHPAAATTLTTYGVCGRHLEGVLRGEIDALELLFAEPDALAARIYDAELGGYHNALAADLLAAAVADWPAQRPLRILELGGGTGSLTVALLPHLRAHHTQYVFTDVSSAHFPRAKARFEGYDFLDYRVLDLDTDPVRQGFTAGSFDVVVAGNVLHTARDLAAGIRHAGGLLADGGQLLAVESHSIEAMAPVFGLLDSFWTATDTELRPDGPLLDRDSWRQLLAECGFTGTVQCGDDEEPARGDQSVLLTTRACGPTTPSASTTASISASTSPSASTTASISVSSTPADSTPPSDSTPPPDSAARPRHWLLLGELDGTPGVEHLAAALRAGSSDVVECHDSGLTPEPLARRLAGRPLPTDIAVLATGPCPAVSAVAETDAALGYLTLLRALDNACPRQDDRDNADPVTVWLVAEAAQDGSGARPVRDGLSALPARDAAAALWAAARCLANERPDLAVRRIALTPPQQPAATGRLVARLVDELRANAPEDEVLLTEQGRFAAVVRPLAGRARAARAENFTLALEETGLRYRLGWRSAEPLVPGPGQVVLQVAAAGLNYRDVLIATGKMPPLPDPEGHGIRLGFECAGTVMAVGPGVTRFAPGDRVMGPAAGCLGSHVRAEADHLLTVPADMPLTEAATLPITYLTAHYGLHHLARLAPGETVLVHGAAGGVGMAALQIARQAGAHVVATAGTPAKRALLRLLGIEHVLDSRSLYFADQVKDLTDGEGVDVVLNQLAGEALVRSVGLLKPGGRFIELGKQDFLADNSLPLGALQNNIAFHAVDVSLLLGHHQALAGRLNVDIGEAVHSGAYRPLPHRVYPAGRLEEAFADLQHSRHFGKVVIDFTTATPFVPAAGGRGLRVEPEATYLVIGGLSGLGAATARHLAESGARHLTLVSRRGGAAPEAPALMEDLRSLGVTTLVCAADCSEEQAVRGVLEQIDAAGRRLAGVVNAAMVNEDTLLAEASDEQMRAMLAPKLTASRHLDQLTQGRDLDFFIVYSSMAVTIGNIRQAVYAAANLAMEGLVRARRRRGQHALAVAWGVITDTGAVQRSGRVEEVAVGGLGGRLSSAAALAALDRFLAEDVTAAAVCDTDWSRVKHWLPSLTAPRTAAMIPQGETTEHALALRDAVVAASETEALELVEGTLCALLAEVLHIAPERIDRRRRPDQMGVDSLMAAEFAVRVRSHLGCDLQLADVLQAEDLTAVARLVLACFDRTGATDGR